MRAYKLNETWIDLDTIQMIGPMRLHKSHMVCEVQFAFQNKPQDLNLGTGNNPRDYVDNCPWNTKEIRDSYDARARKAYDKLVTAWKTR